MFAKLFNKIFASHNFDPILAYELQAISLIGKREENQDNYLIIGADATGDTNARWLYDGKEQKVIRPNWPIQWLRLVIMDGMGGHSKGREITEVAAIKLRDLPPCTTPKKQHRTLLKLHNQLQTSYANAAYDRNPGTTIIWAEIDLAQGICTLIHVGDSRAWFWNPNSDKNYWQQLTWDHTKLEFEFRNGHIDIATYLQKSKKNQRCIAQALGYGSWGGMWQNTDGMDIFGHCADLRLDTQETLPAYAQNHADVLTFKLCAGTALLLASDGLWDAVPINLRDPSSFTEHTAYTFAQEAINAGGQDNTSLVFAKFSAI